MIPMKEVAEGISKGIVILSAFAVLAFSVAAAEYYIKKARWRAEFVVSLVICILMFVTLCLNCYYLHWTTFGLVAALVELVWVVVFGALAVMFYEETREP